MIFLAINVNTYDLGIHLVAFSYLVNELETDHTTINVDNFVSWFGLSVNNLDW